HATTVEVQLLHQAVEARERAVQDLDAVADLIVDADLGLGGGGGGFVLGVEDARGFGVADRLGLARGAEEAGDLGRVLDEVVDVVVHRQLGQHIAGEEFAVGGDLLAAADLGDLLGRDFDRLDELLEPQAPALGDDRLAHLVLEAGISVDDVPAGHSLVLTLLGAVGVPGRASVWGGGADQPIRLSRNFTIALNAESTPKKKIPSRLVMITTMIVVLTTSWRRGQLTLAVSTLTSFRNLPGLTLATWWILQELRAAAGDRRGRSALDADGCEEPR